MGFRHTICVDLDGTLIRYDGYKGDDHFGDPLPGAIEFTKKLSLMGKVVIFTARSRLPGAAEKVRQYLDKHGFKYDEVYEGKGKPIASAYIDDRAVTCKPQETANPYSLYEVTAEKVWELVVKNNKDKPYDTTTSTVQ